MNAHSKGKPRVLQHNAQTHSDKIFDWKMTLNIVTHILVSSALVSNNPASLSAQTAQIEFQTEDHSFLACRMMQLGELIRPVYSQPLTQSFLHYIMYHYPLFNSFFKLEDGGGRLLWNVSTYLPYCKALLLEGYDLDNHHHEVIKYLIHKTIYIKPVSSILMWSKFCQPQTFWDTNQWCKPFITKNTPIRRCSRIRTHNQ